MRIAVVQRRAGDVSAADQVALAAQLDRAGRVGAEWVVVPEGCGGDLTSAYGGAGDGRPPVYCIDLPEGTASIARLEPGVHGVPELGPGAVLVGDACFAPTVWHEIVDSGAMWLLMHPNSEGDLQAEAVIELAIALSDSVCGLVIVAENGGAEPGVRGHGGSVIVQMGEVLAEAVGDEDLLTADIPLPIPQPEPREPLPIVPAILLQRVAHHEGHRLDVSYLADLSDGPGHR